MAEYTEAQYIYTEARKKSRVVESEVNNYSSRQFGYAVQSLREYDQALHFTMMLYNCTNHREQKYQCSHLGNIGLVHQKKGDYDLALSHFQRHWRSHWRLVTKD